MNKSAEYLRGFDLAVESSLMETDSEEWVLGESFTWTPDTAKGYANGVLSLVPSGLNHSMIDSPYMKTWARLQTLPDLLIEVHFCVTKIMARQHSNEAENA